MKDATLTDENAQESFEAPDSEFFPIYAESGMTPDDFVPATAERYADYLECQRKG